MKVLAIELNDEGIRELLKSAGVQAAVSKAAAMKAAQAGDGYAASEVRIGVKRAWANIYPATKKAAHDNYVNNTLEKVIRS